MASSVLSSWGSLILHGVKYTGKEIGRGAYGRVFEVDYEGTLCAAKEVHAQYAQGDNLQKIQDNFLSECQIWSTLRHPCIVQFLGVYYPEMDQYRLPVIVMEKMQQSLKSLVENYNDIPLNVKLSILDEVCLGLRYLHNRNPPIVHGDLTPNNVLLSYRLEAKITDLGVAKVVRSNKLPGTPDFMPPEALSERPVYEPSVDVFSYGGVILNVTTQLWPEPTESTQFDEDTNALEVVSEAKRRQEYLDKMTKGAADLKPLVISCLNDSPKNRPPVAEVSKSIRSVKDVCSQKSSRDGMSPIVWWAEAVSSERQSQVTNSLTTALEEMKRENEELKDEISQLRTEVQKLKESITPGDLSVNIKWEEGAPAPVGRVEQTVVWLNGLIYVGGGYVDGGYLDEDRLKKPYYSIESYNPVSNSWNSPIKTPYCKFAMTTLNNKLLIAGGLDEDDNKTKKVLTMDDDQLKSYTIMTKARYSTTAAGHQGMLIITGGMDIEDEIISSTELFDSTKGQWYTCSDLPNPCCLLKSVIVDNILYLLGGADEDGYYSPAVFTASLDTLSSHQLKWNTHQDTPWHQCAPVSVNGVQLLIVGGGKKTGDQYTYATDVYKLNKVSHTWEAMGHIPSARKATVAVSTADNRVIVIGGYNDKGDHTNTVWIGSFEPK